MKSRTLSVLSAFLLLSSLIARAEVKNAFERNADEKATAGFKFNGVPAPSKNDAATKAKFTIVDGERDRNGGDIDKLHDGKLPAEGDQPSESFFFNASTDGGRIVAWNV